MMPVTSPAFKFKSTCKPARPTCSRCLCWPGGSVARMAGPAWPHSQLVLLLQQIGDIAFLLAIPIAAAYTAFSLADRQGMMPALILGYYATVAQTGYVGAVLCAFMVSGLLTLSKRLSVPHPLNSIYNVILVPLLATATTALVFHFALVPPLAWLRGRFLAVALSLGGPLRFCVGALVAAMIAYDMGGKVGKRSTIFSNACLAEGWFLFVTAKIIGCMVLLLYSGGNGSASKPTRKRGTAATLEGGAGGPCQITESILPYAQKEPRRIVLSITAGSALAGGLAMYWSCACQMPHGGIFILPLILNPHMFLLALLAGSLLGGLLLALLRVFMKSDPPRGIADLLDDKQIDLNF